MPRPSELPPNRIVHYLKELHSNRWGVWLVFSDGSERCCAIGEGISDAFEKAVKYVSLHHKPKTL